MQSALACASRMPRPNLEREAQGGLSPTSYRTKLSPGPRSPPRRCRPQIVILNNINLPDHAGWFREHLLQAGLWREVISGYVDHANPSGNAQKLHGNASLRAICERRLQVDTVGQDRVRYEGGRV